MLFRKSKAPAATAVGAPENVDGGSTTTADEHQHQQELSTQQDGGKVTKAVSSASTRAESDYPTGVRLALILLSIFVSMFLVALDRLIISTAIPQITDDFHSLPDVEKAAEAGREADREKATLAETAAAAEPVPTGKSS
ncbi:Rubrofusarin-specific efflux pump aurT [Apiospora arundinis]